MQLEILQANTIYQVITGSTAYGLATETSDVDQKAVVLLPPAYNLQLSKPWETTTYHDPDIEFHSLKKAMHLFRSQNPTMLETLFVPEQFIVSQNKYGKILRQQRHLFLSQNCYNAFGGYARDQLMRIKNGLGKTTKQDHYDHLHETLERMSSQLLHKLDSNDVKPIEITRVYSNPNQQQEVDVDMNFTSTPLSQINRFVSELANTLKSYNKKKKSIKQPTNKLYKHAMHVVRLLLMGIEVLDTGELTVYREKDRDFLLAIRNGNYTWDEVFQQTNELFIKLEQAKQTSILPEKVNQANINQLYVDLISDCYGIKKV
ncbi:DNA polymerase beta superfamily protein [Aquibacillus sediminis]|uniref:DNA polymerase beta superfamily protein n=1 Tax=Aquibacillus sediminis TaxID=2574734 RepID=UPI001487443B|nr:nucleotidyltransferase domain-containing protein [Aquibacillus sediminis]